MITAFPETTMTSPVNDDTSESLLTQRTRIFGIGPLHDTMCTKFMHAIGQSGHRFSVIIRVRQANTAHLTCFAFFIIITLIVDHKYVFIMIRIWGSLFST